MRDRYEGIETCDDVRTLAAEGIGESLTLDYKQELKGGSKGRKDLAADVCAFSNTQGGLLIVGVRDPEPEGAPPKDPDDFCGVKPEPDLVHKVESRLLDSISPKVYTQVKTTTDTFTNTEGEERCFLLIRVPAGTQLHQVTVERDFKFYRRAEYQNRSMTHGEVRERMETIISSQISVDGTFTEETDRLSKVIHGDAQEILLSAPTISHTFVEDPASLEIRGQLTILGKAHSGLTSGSLESPLTSSAYFIPAGNGARSIQRHGSGEAWTECRVRRDSLISHAQNSNSLEPENLILKRHTPADELWREPMSPERPQAEAEATENMRWCEPIFPDSAESQLRACVA